MILIFKNNALPGTMKAPQSADKTKTWYTLGLTFTYYHLFPFAITLKLDYLWQIIEELMNVQQNPVHMLPQAQFSK